MAKGLLIAILSVTMITGVAWIMSGSANQSHCGTCMIPPSGLQDPQPVPEKPITSAEPACPKCERVTDVLDLTVAIKQKYEVRPFVSFDEPPIARDPQAIFSQPAAPRMAVAPTAYLQPVPEREVAPEPRSVQ
jgi:hypothetical protein